MADEMSPTDQVNAIQGQPTSGVDSSFALLQLLAALQGAGGGGGMTPGAPLPGVGGFDPRAYAPLLQAMGRLGYNTPPVTDPMALRQSMYPTPPPSNGPYVQWMGGSVQPQKWDKSLAAAALLHNLVSGWAQGRHQAEQAGTQFPGSNLPPQAPQE